MGIKKIDLTTVEQLNLKTLDFEMNQFHLPENFYANFPSAQKKMVFVQGEDGKQKASDDVEKVIVPAYDADLVETLKKVGQNHEKLKSLDIAITEGLGNALALIEEEYVGRVVFTGLKVRPKWVQRIDNEGKRSGSWNDVQVIAEKVEKVRGNKTSDNSGKAAMPKI